MCQIDVTRTLSNKESTCNHCTLYIFIALYFVINPMLQLDSLGHYTVYALEGRGGEVRWHLTPKDFQFNPAFSPVSLL